MAKTKQISINQIDKIIASQTDTYPKDNKRVISYDVGNGETVDIEVTPLLSIEDMSSMVHAVVGALFDNDTYTPAMYELVHSKAILVYYTNLKSDMNNDKLNQIVYCTDIVNKVVQVVNISQFEDINYAICKAIEFRKQEILSTQNRLLEENYNQLVALTNTMSTFGEKMKGVDMNELMDNFKKLANTSEKERVNNVLEFQYANRDDKE